MKVIITTDQGTLIETIPLQGYNLDKSMAKADLLAEILNAVVIGYSIEKTENEERDVADLVSRWKEME